MKKQAISGVKWTSASSIVIMIVQLIQLAVLAHYLEPSDFGLMGIVVVIIGFSTLFLDVGISASIIHRQDISDVQLSSLFWLNIIAGIALFLIIYSLAPIFGYFYNEVELIPIIRLLAIAFVVSAIGNQYGLLLQKTLKFKEMAKISVIAVVLACIVAVLLAFNGYGVYALVYASLTTKIVTAFLNVKIGFKEYKLSWTFRYKEVVPMISFGMFQMGERSINYFNSQFDVILIGKLLGTEALGIYSVAKDLSMRPAQIINPIINKVSFPVMAKVQNDVFKLKVFFLKTINYLASINFPIYLLIVILAEPIIIILFGEKWHDSIVILQILSVYGAIRSVSNPVGSLILARGQAKLGFQWNLRIFFIVPPFIYVGSFFGLNGVAYSLLSLMLILVFPGWFFLIRPLCEAEFREYILKIIEPLILSILGGVLSYSIGRSLEIDDNLLKVIIVSLVMGLSMLFLNIIFNQEFKSLLFDLRNQITKQRK